MLYTHPPVGGWTATAPSIHEFGCSHTLIGLRDVERLICASERVGARVYTAPISYQKLIALKMSSERWQGFGATRLAGKVSL